MIYDYLCEECEKKHEEIHGMLDKPKIKCRCGGKCIKLIGTGQQIMGMAAGRGLYDFVDTNTTGKPVRIHSKRQWNDHLKRLGMNDDVKNDPFTKSDMEAMQRREDHKKDARRHNIKKELREVISTVPREKRIARGRKVLNGISS